MRMFDSSVTHTVITVLSCGVAGVNVILIYAIWKHSPASMGKFKNYMLIMSIADFTFAFSISFLFLPNLLFPLPAGIVVGFLKYLGPIGGPIAYWISTSSGGWMMIAVWQCCMYRMYVFYQFDRPQRISDDHFVILMILEVLVISSIMAVVTYFSRATYQEFLDYAQRHGQNMSSDIVPETPLVAFDLDKWHVTCGTFLIAFFMFAVGACIGILNVAVQKKINQIKSSMSSETYRMQKSLTVILLAQA